MSREAAPSVARARLAAPTTSLMPMLQGASAARFFGRDGKPEQLPPPSTGWCAAPSVPRLVACLPVSQAKWCSAHKRAARLVTRARFWLSTTHKSTARHALATAARLSTPSPRHSHTNTMDLRPPRLYK